MTCQNKLRMVIIVIMIKKIEIKTGYNLDEYRLLTTLKSSVDELEKKAANCANLKKKTIWMVNSTATGGGVAEMLPRMISILRQLGFQVEWLVISPDNKDFFQLTKKIHNNLHGSGNPGFSDSDRNLMDQIGREMAGAFEKSVKPDDILVIHDPQPLPAGYFFLQKNSTVQAVWRCHIGIDKQNEASVSAWQFLKPYLQGFQQTIFSAQEYAPDFLKSFTQVIYPAIDPLTHKNRPLTIHKTTGILANAGLLPGNLRIITPQFEHKARVLKPDGNFSVMDDSENGNLLYQPLLTQISRWDRLKGFQALMKAFVELKSKSRTAQDTRHQKRLELVKLVLAGPDPAFIADDPEGLQVLEELKSEYLKLPKEVQKDLYLVLLPMNSAKENALIVNCLQRISTIVIQNSIREGFGLTATEAMWKSVPVLVSGAFGLTKQVRDQVEGRIHNNAEDYIGLSKVLDEMLFDARGREIYAYNGLSRVVDQFLVFKQLTHWLDVLGSDGFVRNKN